ncbi:integrase family protein [Xylanimonas cellulosilytica DSM 15894]|uniref:Integrase family protein n=1 Tax=Xylanimonas cellulosilytica (strain DSM 15894 / JCM 12276 / CECT 5975 / KCTC 9989 / LMG 20990 / NBRC 107835 / XIL07) TaxID=446471 RepID=D1BU78_XYLCX|nr:site-specific integrase [Xylanimonas cellulosilytica]ACZ31091.1 integrase family protein [Xylanimonas cellulosilytica DSM 15894]
MASIKARPDRGGKWEAQYRDASGRRHRRQFDRKRDAEKWIDEVTAAVVTGTYVDPKAGRMTFREYADHWRSVQVHRESTADQIERNFRNHVYPVLGDKQLASILRSDVQGLVKKLSMTLAPATVSVIYRHVSSVLKAAVADRKLATSPCVGVSVPKARKAKVVPLEVDLVTEIAEAVPPRYRAMVIVDAATGLRQGEIWGLTVDRVDFLRRTANVDRQLVSVAGARPSFGPLKTEASYRVVPLPKVAVEALAAHLAEFPTGRDGLIFTSSTGAPLRRSAFGDVWRAAVVEAQRKFALAHPQVLLEAVARVFLDAPAAQRLDRVALGFKLSPKRVGEVVTEAREAGLIPAEGASAGEVVLARARLGERDERVVFHELRHFYASLLIRHGESVKTVQARLGHASAVETLDTYSHLWPDSDDLTRDAVDSALGSAVHQVSTSGDSESRLRRSEA